MVHNVNKHLQAPVSITMKIYIV